MKIKKLKFRIKNCGIITFITILLFVWILSFGFGISFAQAKEYDGLWFMGFNLHKDLFGNQNGNTVRKAINYAVNRKFIATKIIGDTLVPTGVVPYGMPGYNDALKGFAYDVKYAKQLMKTAGYALTDPRLKNLSLLHTDGKKTIEIAKAIEKNLQAIGIKINRVMISYREQDKWNSALESGTHHLFLMGYKASPIIEDEKVDTFSLLQPLFHSEGSANFTFFRNSEVDLLLDQIAADSNMEGQDKAARYEKINEIIQANPPTVNLFYITKL